MDYRRIAKVLDRVFAFGFVNGLLYIGQVEFSLGFHQCFKILKVVLFGGN